MTNHDWAALAIFGGAKNILLFRIVRKLHAISAGGKTEGRRATHKPDAHVMYSVLRA